MSLAPSASRAPLRTGQLLLALVAWLALAIAVGSTGLLGRLRPPGPQLVLLALTVALLAAGRLLPALRAWRRDVDPRALIAAHVGRCLAGGTFLLLVSRGVLPQQFVQAGVGDVTVGLLAAALVAFVPPGRPGARRLYLAWNVVGLADILLVLSTGVRLGMRDPAATMPFGELPLALLPLFYVPIVLATHAWLFARLRAAVPSRRAAVVASSS